jgi:hypothetical protein
MKYKNLLLKVAKHVAANRSSPGVTANDENHPASSAPRQDLQEWIQGAWSTVWGRLATDKEQFLCRVKIRKETRFVSSFCNVAVHLGECLNQLPFQVRANIKFQQNPLGDETQSYTGSSLCMCFSVLWAEITREQTECFYCVMMFKIVALSVCLGDSNWENLEHLCKYFAHLQFYVIFARRSMTNQRKPVPS